MDRRRGASSSKGALRPPNSPSTQRPKRVAARNGCGFCKTASSHRIARSPTALPERTGFSNPTVVSCEPACPYSSTARAPTVYSILTAGSGRGSHWLATPSASTIASMPLLTSATKPRGASPVVWPSSGRHRLAHMNPSMASSTQDNAFSCPGSIQSAPSIPRSQVSWRRASRRVATIPFSRSVAKS